MSDPVADAIKELAAATRENTELQRQIASALFEIAGQGEEGSEEPATYIDGTPRS